MPYRRYSVQRRGVGRDAPQGGERCSVAYRAVADDKRTIPRRRVPCRKLLRRYAQDLTALTDAREALGEDLAAFGVEHGENTGPFRNQQGRGGEGGQRRVSGERCTG